MIIRLLFQGFFQRRLVQGGFVNSLVFPKDHAIVSRLWQQTKFFVYPPVTMLGHFFFVFIHPYMDGNGRLGRFLMNYLLTTGGHPWVIVPVQRRASYMAALEQASTHGNIKPFAKFIARLMVEQRAGLGMRAAPADSRRTPAKSKKK